MQYCPLLGKFTQGIMSFLPVPLHFVLQSILVLSWMTTGKCVKQRKNERHVENTALKLWTSYEWSAELSHGGRVWDWIMWAVSTNSRKPQNERRKCDYIAGVWGRGQTLQVQMWLFLPKPRFDVAVASQLEGRLFEVSNPCPRSFPLAAHYSPHQLEQAKTTQILHPLQSGLNRYCPVWFGPVQLSHI